VQFAPARVLWRPPGSGIGHRVILDPCRWFAGCNCSEGLCSLHAAPEAREADPIAEGVDEDDGVEGAGADVDEGGEPAEESRVGELEERAEQDGKQRRVGVCKRELVEMVDVGDAEVERCDEGCRRWGDFGEEVDGNEDGAEEDFFGDGAGNVVTVTNPREKGCGGSGGVDAFNEEAFEEGPREEGGG
jgi:hypothetical protein